MRRPGPVSRVATSHLVLSKDELGESPVFPTLAILGSAALYTTLPSGFVAGSTGVFSVARWIVPALTVILLVVLLARGGTSSSRSSRCRRSRRRARPLFLDCLYVSFTNATAFSPTDAMPLNRWAKMLMLVESAASLLLAIMVVVLAVNILK